MERIDISSLFSTGHVDEFDVGSIGLIYHCIAIKFEEEEEEEKGKKFNKKKLLIFVSIAGSLLRASSFFVYTLCGIAAVSWPLCRVQQKKKATNVRTIMEQNSATGHQRDAATVAADRAEIERDAARAKQRQQSQ